MTEGEFTAEDVERVFGPAIDRVRSDEPLFACEEVMQGAVPTICRLHPESGLLCSKCALEHEKRHPDRAGPCDLCGARWAPNALALTVTAQPNVRRPLLGDKEALFLVPVEVGAWGVRACDGCARQWAVEATPIAT